MFAQFVVLILASGGEYGLQVTSHDVEQNLKVRIVAEQSLFASHFNPCQEPLVIVVVLLPMLFANTWVSFKLLEELYVYVL